MIREVCAEHFSLDDTPRLGGLVEVDSNQIKTLVENNQCYTTREISNVLKNPKSIRSLVKMKNVSFTEKTKQNFWPTQ